MPYLTPGSRQPALEPVLHRHHRAHRASSKACCMHGRLHIGLPADTAGVLQTMWSWALPAESFTE